MAEWDDLHRAEPWIAPRHERARVGETMPRRPAQPGFRSRFPEMARLLGEARSASVVLDDAPYELLTWDSVQGTVGWLCLPPTQTPPASVHSDHALLLSETGGIVERFNEWPQTWLLNHSMVLTAPLAERDAGFLQDYAWAFPNEEIPIRPGSYYSIAREANGNTTLCEWRHGEILLFAADHSFDHIEPLPGCPDYTLYRISRVPDFQTWVEVLASQWLAAVG